ncbi:RNHCP domain-containing protein [Candidatus Peregrinibacteria bacterium]|nr:RNHCP domain-containing protein [Candidatus Peregrinibacteria bacterium]
MPKTPKINETFACKNCRAQNPEHANSCRNHCYKCLYSLHVDKNLPGDRMSNCQSLMQPIKADQNGKKGWMIYHKCMECGKIMPNKAAPDDDFGKIVELASAST